MAETLIERVWAWLHATFPERQVYIRSDGRVQFFTFGPTLQATMAGLTLIFLGWVAFASVNVIFKDRIIAAKDHRYQQMQSTYENRLADLQVSYDELNGALVSAEDTFKSTADQLEIKQRTVAKLLGRKDAVDQSAGEPCSPPSRCRPACPTTTPADKATDSAAQCRGRRSRTPAERLGDRRHARAREPAATHRQTDQGELSRRGGPSAGQRRSSPKPAKPTPHKVANLPAFRALAHQTVAPEADEPCRDGPARGRGQADDRQHPPDRSRSCARSASSPARWSSRSIKEGIGGPFVPISALHIDGIADPTFTKAFAEASAHVKELDTLFTAFRHVPLTTPVHGSQL